MHLYARRVVAGDARNECHGAAMATFVDEAQHEFTANSASLVSWSKVDGGLKCAAVCFALFPFVGVAVAADVAVSVFIDVVWEFGRYAVYAFQHLATT